MLAASAYGFRYRRWVVAAVLLYCLTAIWLLTGSPWSAWFLSLALLYVAEPAAAALTTPYFAALENGSLIFYGYFGRTRYRFALQGSVFEYRQTQHGWQRRCQLLVHTPQRRHALVLDACAHRGFFLLTDLSRAADTPFFRLSQQHQHPCHVAIRSDFERPAMNFQDHLATFPDIAHLAGLDIEDAAGHTVHHIPAVEGKLGSLKLYYALCQRFNGRLDAEAAAQGLLWFAEHTADAQAHPGKHPNVDFLQTVAAEHQVFRLKPLSK